RRCCAHVAEVEQQRREFGIIVLRTEFSVTRRWCSAIQYPEEGGSMRRDAVIGAVLAGWLTVGTATAIGQGLTPVPKAKPKVTGVSAPNVLSVELAEVIRAQGSMALENPQEWAVFYGYNKDVLGQRPFLPPFGSIVEATKTEPDKNTYL